MRKLKVRSVADLMRVWFRIHPESLGQPYHPELKAVDQLISNESGESAEMLSDPDQSPV